MKKIKTYLKYSDNQKTVIMYSLLGLFIISLIAFAYQYHRAEKYEDEQMDYTAQLAAKDSAINYVKLDMQARTDSLNKIISARNLHIANLSRQIKDYENTKKEISAKYNRLYKSINDFNTDAATQQRITDELLASNEQLRQRAFAAY